MSIIKRQFQPRAPIDVASSNSMEHNIPSGSKKVINNIGYLEYLGTNGSDYQLESAFF